MRETDRVQPLKADLLSNNWGELTRYTYRERLHSGEWREQVREAYDRGHGVCALLHNPETDHVLLTRQFRLPIFLAGDEGPLVEVPAGLLEGADPGERVAMEIEEETGFRVSGLKFLYDLYMSPGSVTERIGFYIGTYSAGDRVAEGGGVAAEGESIEVIEMPFSDAMAAIGTGDMRDAKTVVLLQHLALTQKG
ncbi:MAG: NUDIX domain-containing protein [Pseudomonadota bacterium]